MIDRDDDAQLTDADLRSQTRFGPRPTAKGHRVHSSRLDSRRIPPHGDVSPDGKRIWPRPSLTARLVVWGGTAAAVAGATAGAVILGRQIAGLLSARDDPAGHAPPRRARPQGGPSRSVQDLADRAERRAEVSDRDEPGDAVPDPAGRRGTRRPPRGTPRGAGSTRRPPDALSLTDEIEASSKRLTGTVAGLVGSLGAALSGFHTVSTQARGILEEFGETADLIRKILHGQQDAGKTASRDSSSDNAQGDAARDDRRTHRL